MFNFSLFSISSWGIDLDRCDAEWFALEMNSNHSVFETASKHCISNSLDHDGYSISSKGFLPTVVDIVGIWTAFTHSHSLIHWFLRCQCSLLPSSAWLCPAYLDLWTSYSRFLCSIFLYSIRFYFHHQTYPQLSIVSALTHPLHSFCSS